LVVALPVLLAGWSTLGYCYSASVVIWRTLAVVVLWLAFLFARDALLRGLWLLRRETVRREVRKSRQRGQEIDSESDREFHNDLLQEAVAQVESVSGQTARLARLVLRVLLLIGLYLIWQDVLPAFRFLGETDLYAIGDTQVTLAGLLAALLALVITVVAVRTLPGIVSVYALSRAGMTATAKSGVTAITAGLLAFAGVLVVGSYLGLTWDRLQWLAAAVSVGLGFGLREIAANCASAFLLWFGRRVRIGDIVTVGETTGRVTSIRVQSTTITDWNHREEVIPNKELVVGRVTNWTLSEGTIRQVIPVGIAYGSDTRKAEEILVRLGSENEFTLNDPPVQAVFAGFGDSSLDFELRVWLPNMDHYFQVRHDLHRAIDDAFREAGITIAFPQLDVHLDSPREDGRAK
jgi:potassium efflux system protein